MTISLVAAIKTNTICITILFILQKWYHLISLIDYFMVKYVVSLGVLIMTSSYWLLYGALFTLVSMAILEQPENTYLGTKVSTLIQYDTKVYFLHKQNQVFV